MDFLYDAFMLLFVISVDWQPLFPSHLLNGKELNDHCFVFHRRKSYRFGMTWGWEKDDGFSFLGKKEKMHTSPLKWYFATSFCYHLLTLLFQTCVTFILLLNTDCSDWNDRACYCFQASKTTQKPHRSIIKTIYLPYSKSFETVWDKFTLWWKCWN